MSPLILEQRACLLCNRACVYRPVERLFVVVSRLGDGLFWYVLMLSLPLTFGMPGLHAALHLATVGLACTLVYKLCKIGTRRQRPYYSLAGLRLSVPPLDEFSFPSGHTLHAFCFTILFAAACPPLAVLLVFLALLIALSRLVLGLHYLSDIIAGALIGIALALASIPAVGALGTPLPVLIP